MFDFRWLNKNDMPVVKSGAIRVVENNLYFEDPQQIDSGNYTFIVNNTAGEKRQNVWIIISGLCLQFLLVIDHSIVLLMSR